MSKWIDRSDGQKGTEPESKPSSGFFCYNLQNLSHSTISGKRRGYPVQEKFGEKITAEVSCGSFGTFSFTSNPETPDFHRGAKL